MVSNFLFHRVSPERDPLWDPMDTKLFEKCIKYICNNFEVVLAEDLYLRDKIESNKKYATIMFDDGYKDNYDFALPILEKYNCKASFYVVTNCIEKNEPTWTYILDYIFFNTDLVIKTIPEKLIPFNDFDLSSKHERIAFVKKLKPILKNTDHVQRDEIIKFFQEAYSDVTVPGMMMSWEDLSEMKSLGHYIGSHTVTHPALSTVSNLDSLKHELDHSKRVIKDKLGHESITISYPVGSYNDDVIKLSKEAKYQIGLAVEQDISNPDLHTKFNIPRIELYNESWFKTWLRINHFLERIKKTIKYR